MVGTFAVAELIICTIDTHKWAISDATVGILGILISDLESTYKTGPGDVQDVIFQWCFICPTFGNNHCFCSSKNCRLGMMVPSSDSTSL